MLFDQGHGFMGIHAQGDQYRGAHGHTAMSSMGAMDIDFPAAVDHLERGIYAARQCPKRDRDQRIVEGTEPEVPDMQVTETRLGSAREAHVDDQAHAQAAQGVVILAARRGAYEKVIRDLRKVHTQILSRVVYNFIDIKLGAGNDR